jgi:pimeloyl-ACP methyl ester carboxylesterase
MNPLLRRGTETLRAGLMPPDWLARSEELVEGPWRYARLEGPGHWMQLEAPDRVNELLLDFLTLA